MKRFLRFKLNEKIYKINNLIYIYMKKIVIKDNFAFIYLNSNFYNKEVIIMTIDIYKDFFKAQISQIGKYYIIKIEKINLDFTLENISNEFLNYILANEYQIKI